MIGALRGVAQTISYEVRMAILLIRVFSILGGARFQITGEISLTLSPLFWVLLPLWLRIGLAETNRTPFDFAEGESELVSGFNVEYGAVRFAIIFMAEYARIFLIGAVSRILLGAGATLNELNCIVIVVISFFWV